MVRCPIANYLAFKTYHHFRNAEAPTNEGCLAYAYRCYALLRARKDTNLPMIESINSIFSAISLCYEGDHASDGSCDSDGTEDYDCIDASKANCGDAPPDESIDNELGNLQVVTFDSPNSKRARISRLDDSQPDVQNHDEVCIADMVVDAFDEPPLDNDATDTGSVAGAHPL